MEEKLKALAKEMGLEYIETVPTLNGYPKNILGAIVGFNSWEQAEELSKKTNLPLEIISKRDGWGYWRRNGKTANGPLQIYESDYGENTEFFDSRHKENFYQNEVEPFLDGIEEEDRQEFIDNMRVIEEKLSTCEGDDAVVAMNGKYVFTINTRPMYFQIDSKTYAIALIGYEEV